LETITLNVESREARGKGGAHKLRRNGRIPAILYGRGKEATPLAVPDVALREVLSSARHSVLSLDVGAGQEYAVIKQIQYHPVRHQILHLDLMSVDLREEVELPVVVELVGEAPGVEMGGVLDHLLREVTVRGLPSDIPQTLPVDVSALEIGGHLSVGQIETPAGITVLADPDALLVSILPPSTGQEGAGLPEGEQPEELEEKAPETEE
jgi:large subunit ribosomal protein L25